MKSFEKIIDFLLMIFATKSWAKAHGYKIKKTGKEEVEIGTRYQVPPTWKNPQSKRVKFFQKKKLFFFLKIGLDFSFGDICFYKI